MNPPEKTKSRTIRRALLIGWLLTALAGAAHAVERVQVRWVDDGDTVVLADGRRVRYIGIDAPELAHADRPAQPFAVAARRFNERLVRSRRLRLEFDREKTDRYGRHLAYLFDETGAFINRMLLSEGLAWVLYRRPNDRYHDLLLKSQQAAMDARQGLWRNWREQSGRYLGNIRSKRFHLESCPYGRQTRPQNRIHFSRQWDAFRQGYAPGRKCLKYQDR